MARLKPSTRRAAEILADDLRELANDIQPARPCLGELYRLLAIEIENISIPDAPFCVRQPAAARALVEELNRLEGEADRVVNYSSTFYSDVFRPRLIRGMSD